MQIGGRDFTGCVWYVPFSALAKTLMREAVESAVAFPIFSLDDSATAAFTGAQAGNGYQVQGDSGFYTNPDSAMYLRSNKVMTFDNSQDLTIEVWYLTGPSVAAVDVFAGALDNSILNWGVYATGSKPALLFKNGAGITRYAQTNDAMVANTLYCFHFVKTRNLSLKIFQNGENPSSYLNQDTGDIGSYTMTQTDGVGGSGGNTCPDRVLAVGRFDKAFTRTEARLAARMGPDFGMKAIPDSTGANIRFNPKRRTNMFSI